MSNYTAFVPAGDDRRATARMLVDAADENGISQRAIRSANLGFDITEELADVLGGVEEPTEDPTEDPSEDAADKVADKSVPAKQEPNAPQSATGQGDSTVDVGSAGAHDDTTSDEAKAPAKTKKTSGSRAAKNNDSEEE